MTKICYLSSKIFDGHGREFEFRIFENKGWLMRTCPILREGKGPVWTGIIPRFRSPPSVNWKRHLPFRLRLRRRFGGWLDSKISFDDLRFSLCFDFFFLVGSLWNFVFYDKLKKIYVMVYEGSLYNLFLFFLISLIYKCVFVACSCVSLCVCSCLWGF